MQLRTLLTGLFLISACGAFAQDAAQIPPRAKVIVGSAEQVYIPALNVTLSAKVDTGAESASLSAINIKRFLRKGEKWVRFDLAVDGLPPHTFELPLYRNVRITRRASDFDEEDEKHYARRPKVQLELCLGDRQELLDVNLADRRRFSQPMLLGKDALQALAALVDVEADKVLGAPRCPGAEQAETPQDIAQDVLTDSSPTSEGAQ